MRSTEERAAAVRRRARELERQSRARRGRIVGILSAAACLLFVVGLSLAMPGIMAGLPDGGYAFSGAVAGIFDGRGGLGYVLVGLLAFVLGISVTILFCRIRLRSQKDHEDTEGGDG